MHVKEIMNKITSLEGLQGHYRDKWMSIHINAYQYRVFNILNLTLNIILYYIKTNIIFRKKKCISLLSINNEEKFKIHIKIHIKKLQKFDFTLIRECIKSMISNLAERLYMNHKFNKKS